MIAELIWDPLSTAETVRFVNLMQKLQRDYPTVNGAAKYTQVRFLSYFYSDSNFLCVCFFKYNHYGIAWFSDFHRTIFQLTLKSCQILGNNSLLTLSQH